MPDSHTISTENQKPGTSQWIIDRPALNREIEGFAGACSINVGETIQLFVNTKSPEYSMKLFRMGWYQGLGGRAIGETINRYGVEQPIPIPDVESGLVDCEWTDPFNLETNADWMSGVYLIKLEELWKRRQSYIIFVIRNDHRTPSLLFQLPVTTYQAYNYWGGKSLYPYGSGSPEKWGYGLGNRAHKVSFNRPYARSNNKAAAYSMGTGEFFTNVQPVTTHGYPISSAAWDYNMVKWLEKHSYDVSYITNIDTHHCKELLLKSCIFMSHGHDEYWTYEMRKNVTAARDQGINLAFFSSNVMYWQIRLESSTVNGDPHRTIVCYKDTNLDPIKGEHSTIATRELPDEEPEASLIGVQYITDPVDADIRIFNADHWVFQNTGLKNGQLLKGLLGYEVDGKSEASPENTIILTSSKCKNIGHNTSYILKYMVTKIFHLSGQSLEHKIFTKKNGVILLLILGAGCALVISFLGIRLFLLFFIINGFLVFLWYLKIRFSDYFNSNMTIYQTASGAKVFASGSMQWAWGLDDFNVPELRKSRKSLQAEQITHNILKGFGAENCKG